MHCAYHPVPVPCQYQDNLGTLVRTAMSNLASYTSIHTARYLYRDNLDIPVRTEKAYKVVFSKKKRGKKKREKKREKNLEFVDPSPTRFVARGRFLLPARGEGTRRLCSVQLPDSMKHNQADLYLETYQVLDLEMSRLREIQRWQASAASKVCILL
ncbi:hypothetical protein BHM03_00057737 [Ensete ventricosum]|nr:hypothetical protein BHM03_00057737 [Ensete ventricosum]